MTAVAPHNKSHSKGWLFCILLPLFLLLGACGEPGADAIKLSGHTMGTTWNVTYTDSGALQDPEAMQAGLQAQLDEVNASMSTYRDDAEINVVNRAAVNEWVGVSGAFLTVLEAALAVGEQSEGAYDVTVGPLVNLWGFGPRTRETQIPSEEAVQSALASVGQRYLEVDADQRRVRKLRDVKLDFSSVAKGYGVDRLARYLETQQVHDFLVEVGGEMRLSGRSPRGDDWRVAIEKPTAGARVPAVGLALTDVAVATSGDYRNYFEFNGKRFSHSIDPRTGYPVVHDLVSVTVLAPSSMLADAWSTALEVLGAEDALRVASEQGLAVYFIRRQGEELVATHTAAFAPYLAASEAVKEQAQ
ncbi:FAD:protein FMN transferase [Parahaliea maris]|uniref:FAD:protein FMN transferase n=1 Tax=Parahaliea maris TaxID=2716870 RepID=A0A5C8ZZE1_9GAMM|nr:FAD:protein FMN transferase [Parahaliea maris]TXS92992.1 FAD:protein FMN transferase [Parahaliea maris]